MTREVPVGDLVALVDDEDYESVSRFKWWPKHYEDLRVYAHASVGGKVVAMHRFILGAPDGMDVDHENHNGLDNRKSELRLATPSQNSMNRRMRSDNASGYKGVSWHRRTGRWRAQIEVDGHNMHLGSFVAAEEAAAAYDAAALKYFGEFALTNEMMAAG